MDPRKMRRIIAEDPEWYRIIIIPLQLHIRTLGTWKQFHHLLNCVFKVLFARLTVILSIT